MADEHFFPGPGDFPSGLGAAPFFGASYSYAPPAGAGLLELDAAAMQAFGLAWADLQLPDSSGAAHFDSALSSLVSSPAHNGGGGGDDVAIGDLIGRLGSICGGGAAASASNSCYSTPLSSPPRGAAAPSPAFRGCCGYPAGAAALKAPGAGGRLSRVASSKSLGAGAATPASGSPDEAEASRPETGPPVGSGSAGTRDPPAPPAKKRKTSAGKGKVASSAKVVGGCGAEGKAGADADAAAEKEPAKDYIHVRARRGQATDSHSLAERVRRERISERMKMLQSLVPGSNKITGKALMLDEIINYVQSLQRQVEFLAMKLATMNPELDAEARYQATAAMLAPPPAAFPSSYAAAAADPSAQLVDSCAGAGAFRPACWAAHQGDDLHSAAAAAAACHDYGHGLHASPPACDSFLDGK